MNILIDIGHPAHVHIFKNLSWILTREGHNVLFTTRDKEHEIQLLNKYGFNYVSFGKNRKTTLGKIFGLIYFNLRLIFVSIKFKPVIYLSHGSPYAAQVSWLFRKPHISLEDSGNNEQIRLYAPFTKVIITPDFLPNNLGDKQIRYKANHELSYLLPKYFRANESILDILRVDTSQQYAILRFVSWLATHDSGQKGLTLKEKEELVNFLVSKNIKVFISSERHELPDNLKNYAIKIPPDRMHDALAFASIYIGEGATMASEAGVLGTPSIYVSTIVRYYNVDQEKYGLVHNFTSFQGVLNKVEEIIDLNDRIKVYKRRQENFINDKIDFTSFLVWFVVNYPQSFKIMKEDSDYQFHFK
ncbi:MAG TPA: DUF354 domain-containing protein [Tenuifilaceae bacterium]|nr:DUF354 domain-containing protein [Tenuifilaceae bacterium]HPN23203.1 DUF354 domain-containing protein [Tenuifilaceae bacterium]